jgi:hypothetical protein
MERAAKEVTPRAISKSVTNTKSKKQLILEHRLAQGTGRVGASEIRAIEADLRRQLGRDQRTSPSYIANVLRQAGAHVDYDDRYVDRALHEPYASRLEGVLQFHNFESAEAALYKLDELYREYRSAADRVGTGLVRSIIIKGRQRAESIAGNARVRPEKRREKEEIAHWFKVWLDLPDLFFDWLEMRKRSGEFLQMFSNHNGTENSGKHEA